MNTLADEYAEYIMDRMPVGNGDTLLRLMEKGACLEDFCESRGITVQQFEEML